jgi:hypothetical protein
VKTFDTGLIWDGVDVVFTFAVVVVVVIDVVVAAGATRKA